MAKSKKVRVFWLVDYPASTVMSGHYSKVKPAKNSGQRVHKVVPKKDFNRVVAENNDLQDYITELKQELENARSIRKQKKKKGG